MSSCLVVGAGDGVGAAVARRFASEGFATGLVARDNERLARLRADLGPESHTATADAADEPTSRRSRPRFAISGSRRPGAGARLEHVFR